MYDKGEYCSSKRNVSHSYCGDSSRPPAADAHPLAMTAMWGRRCECDSRSSTKSNSSSSGFSYVPTSPRWLLVWIVLTICLQSALSARPGSKRNRKNVLLLIADDMRPQLDMYKDLDTGILPFPRMYTPNIDELASKSLVLGRAYCQVAICSPSRASFLTGRRPDTTRVYDSQSYWRETGGDFTTMPQYFKDHGYVSVGMGKVYHPGRKASDNDDPLSWSLDEYPYFHPPSETYWRQNGKKWSYLEIANNYPVNLNDQEIADHAIDTLGELKEVTEEGGNFFMAVGFRLPHLPFVVPSRYLDYYPESEIQHPTHTGPSEDMPNVAWFTGSELKEYEDIAQLSWRGQERSALPNTTTLNLRRYYCASVTYVDFLIGQVLKRLDDLQLSDDTIVVFTSDHGYQLGEKGLWTKNTNFEMALQVPLMVHVPGLTTTLSISTKIVELIDLFPTLVDLAGLPALDMCSENATVTSLTKVCREGSSFRVLFDDPKSSEHKGAAFSQVYRSPYQSMGYSLRTSRYRYTEWVRFNRDTNTALWDEPLLGAELYDHMNDPSENANVANSQDMTVRIIRQDLSKLLREGWRSKDALPIVDQRKTISSGPSLLKTSSTIQAYLCLYLVVFALQHLNIMQNG